MVPRAVKTRDRRKIVLMCHVPGGIHSGYVCVRGVHACICFSTHITYLCCAGAAVVVGGQRRVRFLVRYSS